jgi:hypothetical protein
MAFSGTVSATVFDTRRVIENAARRCKLPAQSLSAEHVDIANDQLYLLLSDLSNRGVQLWTIEKQIYPLYDGVARIETTDGTVDILNSNLRTLQRVTGAELVAPDSVTVDFTTPTPVSTVGIKWSGPSAPIQLQRSDDGVVWVTVQDEAPAAAAGEWTWYDLAAVRAALYFRVITSSPALNAETVYLGNTPTEIPLARLNRDDYTNLPNKTFTSNRPLQFWFDRQARRPIMHLWPVPNDAAETSQVVVWRQRHIMDVGSMAQELEVPQRWYEAIVASLAAKLASEFVEVDPQLIPILDAKAERALYVAEMEERDNSPITIAPNISMYTV